MGYPLKKATLWQTPQYRESAHSLINLWTSEKVIFTRLRIGHLLITHSHITDPNILSPSSYPYRQKITSQMNTSSYTPSSNSSDLHFTSPPLSHNWFCFFFHTILTLHSILSSPLTHPPKQLFLLVQKNFILRAIFYKNVIFTCIFSFIFWCYVNTQDFFMNILKRTFSLA